MPANLAALMPAPSKAASISCRLASGVRTRPRLSCLRTSPADASRLRHLHDLQQVVLGATLTAHFPDSCAEERVHFSRQMRVIAGNHVEFINQFLGNVSDANLVDAPERRWYRL